MEELDSQISEKNKQISELEASIATIMEDITEEQLQALPAYQELQRLVEETEEFKAQKVDQQALIDGKEEEIGLAQEALAAKKEETAAAQTVADEALANQEEKQASYDEQAQIAEEKTASRLAAEEAQAKAQADVDAKNNEIKAIKKEIADLKARNEALITQGVDGSDARVQELTQTIARLEDQMNNIEAYKQQGAFYFLQWVQENYPEYAADAANGLNLLLTWEAKDGATRGKVGDATSYENLLKTADYLERNNELRLADLNFPDLEALETNFSMMSVAMITANLSTDPALGHLDTFDGSENLAWGYHDPFAGWYDKELVYYNYEQDFIAQYLKNNPNATETEAKAEAVKARKAKYGENTHTGHYLIMMTKRDFVVAIATNNNPQDNPGYRSTHALKSNFSFLYTTHISQEDYRSVMEAFKASMDRNLLAERIAQLEEGLKLAQELNNNEARITELEDELATAKKELVTLEKAVETAKQDVAIKKEAENAQNEVVATYKEELDAAAGQYQEKANTLAGIQAEENTLAQNVATLEADKDALTNQLTAMNESLQALQTASEQASSFSLRLMRYIHKAYTLSWQRQQVKKKPLRTPITS